MYQINKDQLSEKQRCVYQRVETLYRQSDRKTAVWLWDHHVQVVAYFALELAKKYAADSDICFSAALLHDIADIWYERNHPDFEEKTKRTGQEIFREAGFNEEEWIQTFDKVITPHSCYPENMPETLEAKVLATADAMAHLLTDFYEDFQKMGLPTTDKEKFTAWVNSKLERDFNRKIFFVEIKEHVKSKYDMLKKRFESPATKNK